MRYSFHRIPATIKKRIPNFNDYDNFPANITDQQIVKKKNLPLSVTLCLFNNHKLRIIYYTNRRGKLSKYVRIKVYIYNYTFKHI